jgi:hypothetical protein
LDVVHDIQYQSPERLGFLDFTLEELNGHLLVLRLCYQRAVAVRA